MNKLNMALVGVGGFGRCHEESLINLKDEGLINIAAFVEPSAANVQASLLAAQGIPHFRTFDELLAANLPLDFVDIATPIPYHRAMTLAAFEHGLNVYLEKPPVVTIQYLQELIAAQAKAGVLCSVGFNDMARSDAAHLKRRLCDGALGKVLAVRGEARWLRADSYYNRSGWSAKLQLNDEWILDGPMNNSCAHVLNLAAFLAGNQPHTFARPVSVQAELYHANNLSTEDTNCLRAQMDTGVEVLVHLTQCSPKQYHRSWTVIGEKGTACLNDTDGLTLPGERIPLTDEDGQTQPLVQRLIRRFVHAIQGTEPSIMSLKDAEGHLLLSNGAYESSGKVHAIGPEHIVRLPLNDSTATIIPNIDTLIPQAIQEGKLLSEMGLPWTTSTKPYDMTNYRQFPTIWRYCIKLSSGFELG